MMVFFVIYFVVGTNFMVATPKKVSNIYLPSSAFRNWLNLKLNTQSISLNWDSLKLIYSEKAKIFCEIFPLLLTVCTVGKSKVEILQNFVAFSENTNFTNKKLHGAISFNK